VTIQDLEQLRAARKEIAELETKIRRLTALGAETVSDTVRGSSPVFPYTEHVIRVSGVPPAAAASLARIRRMLVERLRRLVAAAEVAEAFIDSIPDSETRILITLHYMNGYSWAAAARRVYGYPGENRARMKVKRFIEMS